MRVASHDQNGASLLELIIILSIVGVLSVLAVATYHNSHVQIQYETVIRKIAVDVRYAQSLAISNGQATRVFIDQSNNRYYLKWDDETYIKTPIGDEDFIVQLGTGDFSAVQITDTDFSNGRLDFDTNGSPKNSGNSFTGKLTLVTLNNAKKMVIIANTGFIQIEDL